MNCKQDHNDNDIRHIFIKKKHAMNNTNISNKRKEKKKCKNKIKYLLA